MVEDLSPSAQCSMGDWSSITQELVNTLPRAWTRGVLYLLVGFAGVVLPWAMLAQVDETGVARGRLEPQGKIYRIDAPVAGKVVAIAVKEGSTVKAGQTLMELDSELAKTDLQQAQAKLEGQLNRLTQLEKTANQLAIATRTQQLQSEAQGSEQQAQIAQVKSKISANQRAYQLWQSRLAKDLNEVQRYHQLWQAGAVPEIKVVETQRTADESQRLLAQARADIEQSQSELAKQETAQLRVDRTGKLAVLASQKQARDLQTQMADLRAEIAQTRQAIAALQLQLQQRTIHAPVNGTIFELPIQQPGAVLQPGRAVAQLAPKGSTLIFRAQMPSSESGFLKVGMPVKLKFDAYPFQDYGIVPAHLHWVSPDTKKTQTPQGEVENFELEIRLDQSYIQAQNKHIVLTPGQSATAEVITRQRRIIDFILDPFRKLQNGDFKL